MNPSQLTPVLASKVESSLKDSKLEPFDQNYTLTGLIKHIDSSLSLLITSKKENSPLDSGLELEVLQKMQEEVMILKTIVIHNINQIFSSIYPNKDKSEDRTNHTDSNKGKNQEELNKSMTISDFDIQGNNKINTLEVSKESLAYYQHRYAEEKDSESEAKRKLFKAANDDKIRIEDEDDLDAMVDLICYEDEKSINNRRRKERERQEIKDGTFSPISQRPIEEECSMQKGAYLEELKQNLDYDLKRITFNPNRDNLYVNILQSGPVKKSLFCQNSQSFKRVSHRKYNYLEQCQRY